MIFRLPDSVYKQFDRYRRNGQSALLQTVRASVKKTYSATGIGTGGQVIVISFGLQV